MGKEALTPAIEVTKAKQHKTTVPKGLACRAALGASRRKKMQASSSIGAWLAAFVAWARMSER